MRWKVPQLHSAVPHRYPQGGADGGDYTRDLLTQAKNKTISLISGRTWRFPPD